MHQVLVVACVLVAVASAEHFYVTGSVSKGMKVVKGRLPHGSQDWVAHGEYNASRFEIGWDTMRVVTNGARPDEDQAYAAGYFEGTQTYQQAEDHHHNSYNSFQNPPIPEVVNQFFDQHLSWLESMIKANSKTDPYWYQVGLHYTVWNGLRDGLNYAAPRGSNQTWTRRKLLSLTALGDLFDIIPAVVPGAQKEWRGMEKKQFMRWFAQNTHCSALVKVTDDLSDIFFGHATWYGFSAMMRIYKMITLNYSGPGTTAKTVSFSSYPGMVSSLDDFYLSDSGLSTIETSLSVLNLTMYKGNIKPELVMYWMRIPVANRMATSAPEWTEIISKYNSGTYNNQWLVLDLNKFTPGQDLLPDTMWIAEQFPGVVGRRDVTEILSYGYYPSYNVPMIKELFWASGYGEAVAKHGPEMNDYEMCVRAQIFRRDQASVHDMKSFQHIMQYNDYEQDPISKGNPLYAISSRVDLDPVAPQCFGGLDAKASSWSRWKNGQEVLAFSGPTPQQPTFGFNMTAAKDCGSHRGIPEVFRFGWQRMTP